MGVVFMLQTLFVVFCAKKLFAIGRAATLFFGLGLLIALAPLLLFKSHLVSLSPPLGLSYYSFIQIALLLDARWRRLDVGYSYSQLLASVSFFPLGILGPIARAQSVAEGFQGGKFRIRIGLISLWLAAVGLTKKFVIADNLSVVIDAVFREPTQYSSLMVWAAVLSNMLRVYFDFSGGIDIVMGIAALLGVKVAPNFDRPLLATNLSDFWRRWHVSLSSWFRDYVFLPLTTTWIGKSGSLVVLCVTFIAVGLWHDLSWEYFTFGLFNGFVIWLVSRRQISFQNVPWPLRLSSWFITYVVLLSIPSVLFSTNSFEQFFSVVSCLGLGEEGVAESASHAGLSFPLTIAGATIATFCEGIWPARSGWKFVERFGVLGKYLAILFLLFLIAALGKFSSENVFLYSRF